MDTFELPGRRDLRDAEGTVAWAVAAQLFSTFYIKYINNFCISRSVMPQFAPDIDRIIVEIAPDGAGRVLTLTQEGLPPSDKEAAEAGWGKMFDALAATLNEGTNSCPSP